jgi:hypothetical protein
MYPSKHARELAILMRISLELDIIGDVSATVDNPSELLAWASILSDPTVVAWRAQDSGHRYIQVTAEHHRAPIRGRIAAVLSCDPHPEFWQALELEPIEAGQVRNVSVAALSEAWAAMPITPAHLDAPHPAPPARPEPAPTADAVDAGEDQADSA